MTTQHRIPQQGTVGESQFVMEESRTHPGLFHTVDLEREFCSCPATVRCFHIRKNQCIACDGYGTQDPRKTYPRLLDCRVCSGSGRAV